MSEFQYEDIECPLDIRYQKITKFTYSATGIPREIEGKIKSGQGGGKAMLNPDMKVLVVDDAATMRRIVRSMLRELGLKNIREAEDGEIALEDLKRQKVDLVISDWTMPKMTGIELLRAIRQDEELKDIPVLMVRAESKKENIVEAVQAGVNGYIVKPFNSETLEEKIKEIFK